MLELINIALNFGDADIKVGRLIAMQKRIYFEYDPNFIKLNLPISPIRLPLKIGTQTFDPYLFEGLPGVFNDSLPDGWGRLLFDRLIRSRGVNSATITPLDRLAHVGRYGLGALVYEPDQSDMHNEGNKINLELIATQTKEVLDGNATDVLNDLLELNGSSAGVRPKALIGVSTNKKNLIHGVMDLPAKYEHWLVKFSNSNEDNDCGAVEFVYSLMAKLAGVEMPNTHLFESKNSPGYFGAQRFDRIGNKRLHIHSACGLLHSDFRVPSLDYNDLIQLTLAITKDMREVIQMYRLAVFNVLSHNRDDHAKNFSFVMDAEGAWRLSPAYDLTFSSGPNGEQSTSVIGQGKNPDVIHLLNLADLASIDRTTSKQIIEQCKDALLQWPKLAQEYGVAVARIREIEKIIK